MEEWNAFVRRTRRRIEYRRRYKQGALEPGDEFYYPPRINPWPIVGGVAAVVALIAAYVTSTDDGGPPAQPVETTVTIPGSGGLSSRDVAGCLSFQTAVSGARDRLASANSPEGATLAESGALTQNIVSGYLRAVGAVDGRFDDDVLVGLLSTLEKDLTSIENRGIAEETAGAPVWGEVFPETVETIEEFGEKFDRRCERGGVLVRVATE